MEAQAREYEAKISRTSGQEAFKNAIQAAELYMKAVKEASTPAEKSRLKGKCRDLIAQAETLKTSGPTAAPPKAPKPRGPRQSRELPTAEKTILWRSSKLHGSVFPPWEADPDPAVFRSKKLDEPLFTDNSEFSFSKKQNEIFDGWKRPAEIFNDSGPELFENIMVAKTNSDLVQDITTDCSVVASLCAVMRHLNPNKKDSLLPTLLYPFDYGKGRPIASQNGKYMFRLNFNGCFRQVVVDDRLPTSKTSRTFFVVDRRNPELIWPALMEKAYLKIRGGYDFPGSNSGTDLWVLTGWIPEQIFLQSDDIELDQTWKRIKNAFEYGDVVVTLGTGRLSRQEEETLGLAGEHDYAVMDLKVQNTGERRMLLKNPWCDGLVWKGFGSTTTVDAEVYPPPSPTLSRPAQRSNSDVTSPSPYAELTGTFWISLEDVVQNFESLYLNWNPSLFTDRQDHHFTWTLPSRAMQRSFAHNPQYSFTPPTSGVVWILLSRHFQDGELPIARSRHTRQPNAHSYSLGFMSIYLFDNADGHCVQLPDRPAQQSPFVDSPQTLLRFEAQADTAYTVVVAQEGLPLPKYPSTLSFFSRSPLTINPATPPLKHYTELESAWTRRTAGGNARTVSFFHNPQFALVVPQPTPISLHLATDADDVPVHVDLVWSQGGRRVTALTVRDIVCSSGEYRRGCALAEIRRPQTIDAGTYTVVASTFEPGQLASFALRVGSDVPVQLRPVLSDAAGRLRSELDPVVFREGESERQRARVTVSRLTRASVVARSGTLDGGASSSSSFGSLPFSLGGSSSLGIFNNSAKAAAAQRDHQQQQAPPASSGTASPISIPCSVRVSFEYGTGPHARAAAVTADGEFADASMGLRTGDVDLDPDAARRAGGLWLVVEQMGVHREGQGIQVDVLSDGSIGVGPWESVDD
ncbi:palb protein [Diaporthe amygdali]|uniref:palb protein n=1 Tax=Phomopsis amygdali TaxID=1214568 RepID=UPI0022FE73D4|nr:palb protein [Diaporthe amygdali]KAJ0108567.1 palb protein [Diaporthe amygdali]